MVDARDPDAGRTGLTPPATALYGHAEYTQTALKLITRTHLRLCLFSPELDRRVWGHPGLVELLRAFALRSAHAEIRILVHRPQRIAQASHRLVELARRLPSRIRIREVSEERRSFLEEYVIGDELAVLRKRRHDDAEAQWYDHAPMEARRLRRRFDALWDESLPARELAELRI
ncbi:hypothetical protein [Solimonas marina]|uniref:DUF7931 domain-containing protein n=1 Tax=Solimonas marina TaxID=2714601 RepID=A0A969WBF5_9GAMM|nr:hypothetical protein [Solimonas marina]NKF23089.1 hypothetical protein [Solimonas marina]